MSADVDMLPRQWNKESIGKNSHLDGSNVSSTPTWKRNLMAKKTHLQKNGLLLDESKGIPDSSALKSVLQGDATATSYFYPASEDNVKADISKIDDSKNLLSLEPESVKNESESILPVHQNPILLQDLERRSKEHIAQISYKPHQWRNSTEDPMTFPVETGEDSVFDDSYKSKSEDESDEVIYGRGFVHRLLLKFSSLAHQDGQPKLLHPHRSTPKGKVEGMYNSEPALSSKDETKKKSNSPLYVTKQDKETEDKSFSDGEDKIEPVSNTLCMFEKLFCSRRKSQEDQRPDAEQKLNGASPIKPAKRKIVQNSAPTKTTFVNTHKIQHSTSYHDDRSHSTLVASDFHSKGTFKSESTVTSFQEFDNRAEPANNVVGVNIISSPIDVKLVTSLFEAASGPPPIKQSILNKEIKNISERCQGEISTSTAVMPATFAKKVEGDQPQLRQHKRHSSKDYLEIKQSDKISKQYKQAAKLSNRVNAIHNVTESQQSSAKLSAFSIARPGKLLIRSSAAGATVDVTSLPKYNDIKTGEFVPASKVYIDEVADDDEDNDLNCEFEGAEVRLEKSMLVKTRNSKNMKILFDDTTTTIHEYPSEQSLTDWFNEHDEGSVIRDTMFFI